LASFLFPLQDGQQPTRALTQATLGLAEVLSTDHDILCDANEAEEGLYGRVCAVG
jgi:hypothetical protein